MFAVIYLVSASSRRWPAAMLAYHEQLRPELRRPLVFSVVVLLLLPVRLRTRSNDLVMRGSVGARDPRVLLRRRRPRAARAGRSRLPGGRRDRNPLPSALYELARPTFRASYDISDCSLFRGERRDRRTRHIRRPWPQVKFNWLMGISRPRPRLANSRLLVGRTASGSLTRRSCRFTNLTAQR